MVTDRRSNGYPWFRKRLAPVTLRDCLLVALPPALAAAVPDAPPTLADLDGRTWAQFTFEQCEQLADLIVSTVRENIGLLVGPGPLALRQLPPTPTGLTLFDLDLSVRTFNAMCRSPFRRDLGLLSSATLESVLSVRQMGAKGLVELLVALEEAGELAASGEESAAIGSDDVPLLEQSSADADSPAFAGGLTEQDAATLGAWCRGELDSLPRSVLRKRLPQIPEDTHVSDLSLRPHTVSAITRSGHTQLGGWLREALLQDLLAMPGFGRTGLRDLLDGIVRLMLQPPPTEDLTALASAVAAHEASDLFSSGDPRFRDVAAGWCRADETLRAAATRIAQRHRDPGDLAVVRARLQSTFDTLQRISEQPLEDELVELASCVTSDLQGATFARYHGWDGLGGVTLQVVGEETGVSRERVRQICGRVEARLRAARLPSLALGRAMQATAECAPIWADDLEVKLQDRQLTHGTFRAQTLIGAAELLGVDVEIRVVTIAGRDRVTLLNDDSSVELDQVTRLVRRIGRRTVEHWGVGRVQDVATAASVEHGKDVESEFATDVLTREDGFRWLHESRGWFWNTEVSRNRLTNQMDKVLCVAKALPVSKLRVAVARNYRMEGQVPPLDILTEFCRQLPHRFVEDDVVRADPPLDPSEILADTELLFYETLAANGSIMSRADLEAVCREHGMNRVTFYVYLGNSPILVSPRRGVYALIGAVHSPERVQELALRPQRGRLLVRSGQLEDGKLLTVYRLSENMIGAGVFGIPTAMKPLIEGDFSLWTSNGLSVGTVSSRDHGAWGLGTCLRQLKAEPGQYLALVFDVEAREALATLGDETLLQQFVLSGTVIEEDPDDDLDEDELPADALPD